ncbi:radical SAM protein [Planctomycetota bacterium]
MRPSYLELHESGELARRAEKATAMLSDCALCPRSCSVDRSSKLGVCRTGLRAVITGLAPHFGEESPLVGRHGSGTIFIVYCNLNCAFCQNWSTSHTGEGRKVGPEPLAAAMIGLMRLGCHNINFVTPSHVVPQILQALPHAIDMGLSVPLVYNSSGYDNVETLRLLDGVFDLYMPDVKFFARDSAEQYCKAPDYPEVVKAALSEMHRQVGDLALTDDGIATRGLLVRHLVMPGAIEDTREIMAFLADTISKKTYVNVMAQYRPCGEADRFPEIMRRITPEEYREAVQAACDAGLERLDDRRRRW